MTCKDCSDYQDGTKESGDGGGGVSYYRVSVANVMMVGCNKHLAVLIKTLNCYRTDHNGELAVSKGEIR